MHGINRVRARACSPNLGGPGLLSLCCFDVLGLTSLCFLLIRAACGVFLFCVCHVVCCFDVLQGPERCFDDTTSFSRFGPKGPTSVTIVVLRLALRFHLPSGYVVAVYDVTAPFALIASGHATCSYVSRRFLHARRAVEVAIRSFRIPR